MATPQLTTNRVTEVPRILYPGDFSDVSASVLAHAAAFARLFGSEISVLHVFDRRAAAEFGNLSGLVAAGARSTEVHRWLPADQPSVGRPLFSMGHGTSV